MLKLTFHRQNHSGSLPPTGRYNLSMWNWWFRLYLKNGIESWGLSPGVQCERLKSQGRNASLSEHVFIIQIGWRIGSHSSVHATMPARCAAIHGCCSRVHWCLHERGTQLLVSYAQVSLLVHDSKVNREPDGVKLTFSLRV